MDGGWQGDGNVDADAGFVDVDGGDLRLAPGSPCIDAALNAAVPEDVSTDADGNPRFADDPGTPDCQQAPDACGDPPVVDMGAYEFQGVSPCQWDATRQSLAERFGKCDGCMASERCRLGVV